MGHIDLNSMNWVRLVASLCAALRTRLIQLPSQKLLEESMGPDRPLISPPTSMYELRGEYVGAPSFIAQIDSLMNQGYTKIIRTKGSILMKPGTRTT